MLRDRRTVGGMYGLTEGRTGGYLDSFYTVILEKWPIHIIIILRASCNYIHRWFCVEMALIDTYPSLYQAKWAATLYIPRLAWSRWPEFLNPHLDTIQNLIHQLHSLIFVLHLWHLENERNFRKIHIGSFTKISAKKLEQILKRIIISYGF